MGDLRSTTTSWGNREPAPVRPEGVLGLVLLLAITGSALVAFAGAPDLGRLPALPSWGTLEVLVRSPNPPLDGALTLAVLLAWLVWAWAAASLAVELALALAEHGPARGAAWLRTARAVADRCTLPLARRAVAAAIVIQLATRPALPALAFASEPVTSLVMTSGAWQPAFTAQADAPTGDVDSESEAVDGAVRHVVQRGDTLWSIAERYYGSGEEFDRVVDANIGKQMPDGRVFDRAGLIWPGWTLDIPLPSLLIEERDGAQWYVVQRGDTLSGIAARLLGEPERYHELFELNAGARLGASEPLLTSPDLIWPELRLRLPAEVTPGPDPATQLESRPEAEPELPTAVVPAPDAVVTPGAVAEPLAPPPASGAQVSDAEVGISVEITPVPTAPVEPATEPTVPRLSTPDRSQADTAAAIAMAGAVGAIGALGLAGARVLRRHRRARPGDEPSIALDQGFAEVDPARVLGQRLAGETDSASEIANRLARGFAAVLTTTLSESERSEVFGKVSLVAVRHGQTSTTCVLSAPPVARAHLLRHLEEAVATAFGDAVDLDAMVTHDGDLFVQLAGIDQRRLRVVVVDDSPGEHRLWPEPLLVSLGLLYDRQTLYANWHALSHVLVAAPMGQAAETVLVGVIASLVARRPPSDLALVTLASPRTLPSELLTVPHQLMQVVDPADGDTLRSVLEQLRRELDRRAVGTSGPGVDVAIVIRELADVGREAWDLLDRLLRDGPRCGVHVLAASERAAAELTGACPGLDEFRTRLVLQTADEDASQALLGAAGAEELGPGGNMLVRLEARTPLRAHAFRVAPDHLARLVALMQEHRSAAAASGPASEMPPTVATESAADSGIDGELKSDTADAKAPFDDGTSDAVLAEPAPSAPADVDTELPAFERDAKPDAPPERGAEHPRSDLLRQLDQAPLRLRCFGARGVWLGERQVWPSSEAVEDTGWELVVLLGIYPVAGIQAETLADTIWDEDTPPDPGSVLRKRRGRLRQELKRLIADLELDPLPTDPKGRVYRLDPKVIASDVHQFVELAAWAKSLARSDAIAAYEEALALYRGDLLDSVAVPTYPWLYDGPSIATSLRPDYHRLQEEVRLRLADLLGAGSTDQELSRAVELYTELTAERPDDDRRWIALLRVQARRGDGMGLEASIRRLRTALVELGQAEKPETARLPLSVQRVLEEVQSEIRAQGETAVG